MVGSICLNTVVNIIIILYQVGRTLYLIFLRYYKRLLAKIVQSKPGWEYNNEIVKDEDYTILNVLKFYETYNYKPPEPPVLTEEQYARVLENCQRMMQHRCEDKPDEAIEQNMLSRPPL